jgi:hypothetical protein
MYKNPLTHPPPPPPQKHIKVVYGKGRSWVWGGIIGSGEGGLVDGEEKKKIQKIFCRFIYSYFLCCRIYSITIWQTNKTYFPIPCTPYPVPLIYGSKKSKSARRQASEERRVLYAVAGSGKPQSMNLIGTTGNWNFTIFSFFVV